MKKLHPSAYPTVYNLYRSNHWFFPLIAAVLLGEQDGYVYIDPTEAAHPNNFYVEHSFGFAQAFSAHKGPLSQSFETKLELHLFKEKLFDVPKVRMYMPIPPAFLVSGKYDKLRSERQRFSPSIVPEVDNIEELRMDLVGYNNVAEVDEAFGVVTRFWRTTEDFINKANAVVAYVSECTKPVSICYAAAEADRRAEIDVFSIPEFRGRGIGRAVVAKFMQQCADRSIMPLWDCYTNNAGSMGLAASVGFRAIDHPYSFLTITK